MSALDHRIPPPVLVAIVGIAMALLAAITPRLALGASVRWTAALALALPGLLMLAAGFRAFRHVGTTINPIDPQAASVLVVTGIYRLTRNPMYVGFALILLALSVALAAPWTLLGPVLFCVFIDRFQIAPEERALLGKFGSAYRQYGDRVRRWI